MIMLDRRHAIAMLIPLAAAWLQWVLWPWITPFVWFLFFPAVFLSARIGGLKGGVPATLLSIVLVWYFFVPPQLSWQIGNPNAIYSMIMFGAMGYLFSQAHERLQRAQTEAENALAQAQAAGEQIKALYQQTLELNELKTQFFSNVSHELRTPLTLILGPVERLLSEGSLPDTLRQPLVVVERNARLLYRHVSDLLDMARLEAGRMTVHYARADIAHAVRVTASLFETVARDRNIQYTVDTPESLLATFDGEKIQRVVLNLLSNAFKFTPDGGRILVRVYAETGDVRIEVSDNGPGIPTELRENVFERFRQVDGQATRRHGGTGLGLAIVKEMAEVLHGRIVLDEAPEGGARFVFWLPLDAPPNVAVDAEPGHLDTALSRQALDEVAPHAPPVASPAPSSAHLPLVLVVEDNADMSAFICSALTDRYRIATAFNGKDGLEKALQTRPDLILSDMMMPALSGEEMLAQLRTHKDFSETPVIMITARADDALRLRLLESGVREYLTKPFSVSELQVRVANVLGERARALVTEARLAAIVQHSDDAIIGKTIEGIVTSWNHGAEKIFGYAAGEMIGRSIKTLFPPERQDEERDILAHIGRGETVGQFETQRVRKDGKVIDVSLTISPIRDLTGRIVGVSKVGRDITARRQAEKALHEKQRLLDRMSRLAKVGGWGFDVESMTGTWTAEIARIHDLEPDGLIRVADSISFFSDADRPVIAAAVARAIENAEAYDLELELISAKNVLKWVRTQGEPVVENGAVVRVEGALQDITDRRLAENEIRHLNASLERRVEERTAELTAANHELDTFAYAVSHDLRAPLRAMSGFSQALEEDYGEVLTGEARDFLHQISQASRKMGELIDGLLSLSRCTRGELQRQPVAISALAESIAQELQRAEPERACTWQIEPDLVVWGEPRMIEVALRNLLGNAWKYTGKTPSARIDVHGVRQEGRHGIEISDNGAGFDTAHAARLFQPFQRLHRQDEFPGIGIGLATVQRVIHRHGGEIQAEAQPDKGARFRFFLPEPPL